MGEGLVLPRVVRVLWQTGPPTVEHPSLLTVRDVMLKHKGEGGKEVKISFICSG